MDLLPILDKDAALLDMLKARQDARLLTALNEKTVEFKDEKAYSQEDMLDKIGVAAAAVISSILDASPIGRALQRKLEREGLVLGSKNTQDILDLLKQHPQWPQEVNPLFETAIRNISLVEQQFGEGTTATQADIDETRTAFQDREVRNARQKLADWLFQTAAHVVNEQIQTGDITTRQAAVDAVTARINVEPDPIP